MAEKNLKKALAGAQANNAQVIRNILDSLNIKEYEPNVVSRLQEFVNSYVTTVLEEAKVLSNHADKTTIDLDDVKLATEVKFGNSTGPPPNHVLAKLAEERNAIPLPPIGPPVGLRLPADRHCLTNINYKLRDTSELQQLNLLTLEERAGETVEKLTPSADHKFAFPKPVSTFNMQNEPSTSGLQTKPNCDAADIGNMTAKIPKAVKRARDE